MRVLTVVSGKTLEFLGFDKGKVSQIFVQHSHFLVFLKPLNVQEIDFVHITDFIDLFINTWMPE